MSYNRVYLDKVWFSKKTQLQTKYAYNGSSTGSNETLATIVASAYFNDEIGLFKVGDLIDVQGNNDRGVYKVSSVTTNVTLVLAADAGDLTLSEGALLLGTSADIAAELAAGAANTLPISDGTTVAYGNIVNANVGASAGIVPTKLAIARGGVAYGDASGVGSTLAAGAADTVPVSDGTDLAYAKLTTSNLDASAGIVGTQLAAAAAIAPSQVAINTGGIVVGDAGSVGSELDLTPAGTIVAGNAAGAGTFVCARYPVLAGTITWSGGGASVAATVTGLLATDVVEVTMRTANSDTASSKLVTATPTTDTLTIVQDSANAANNSQFDYVAWRAFV